MKRKFTQEIKDQWLTALKSGKYVQGTGMLIDYDGDKPLHCCIGVLGEVVEGLDCSCEDSLSDPYQFLLDVFDDYTMEDLYLKNDSLGKNGPRDYSNVIPMIEALEVQE